MEVLLRNDEADAKDIAEEMLEKLTQIIHEDTGNYELVINEDTILLADLGLNSLDLLNLVCIVEDEFDIEISNEDAETIVTVGDAVAQIKKVTE